MAESGRAIMNMSKEAIFAEFMKYDADKNGSVSYDEAHEILKDKLGFSRSQTNKMVRVCDKNGDGKLSYAEFVDFYQRIKDKTAEIMEVFHEFDRNKDGSISLDEARSAMRRMAFNEDEIEALVTSYDANGDGRLQYQEFVKMWNAQ